MKQKSYIASQRSSRWDSYYFEVFKRKAIIDFDLHEQIRQNYINSDEPATREGVENFILKKLGYEPIPTKTKI